MKISICTLLWCACALAPPPPPASAAVAPDARLDHMPQSASEEREIEAANILFKTLRDIVRAGGYEGQFKIPEREQETLLTLLDRLYNITLATVGDRKLTSEARMKKQFLAVLDLLEEITRASADDNKLTASECNTETFLTIIDQMRTVIREQPDDAPPDRGALQPMLEQLFELVRAGGGRDQDVQEFLSNFYSIQEKTRVELEKLQN